IKLLESVLGACSHSIYDPGPPASSGLPHKTVTTVNGTGYIEAIGGSDSFTNPPILQAVGRIFRVSQPTVAPPPTGALDPTYVYGVIDVSGTYYRFQSALGNMVPGALGGGSSDNVLMTWARCSSGDNWTPANCFRQFIGDSSGSGSGSGSGTG